MFIYLRWNIILIQSCIQTSYVSSKFRRETSQLHVGSKSDSLDVFQHVSSLTRAVTCFRYASGRSSSSLSLSLSFFSSLWRMLFNAATTVRHVSEKEGEEGASAWAGGQSYRGGWLASVNGFRGQWREISRPVSQELWTRLLRLVPWTRGGSPGLSRWPMIWNRGRKGKKVKASPPDFCFLLHAIIISFSCFSIVLHE